MTRHIEEIRTVNFMLRIKKNAFDFLQGTAKIMNNIFHRVT